MLGAFSHDPNTELRQAWRTSVIGPAKGAELPLLVRFIIRGIHVSEATLNQRTLGALFQWSPVPATVSDMATLDLVSTYGASVVETAIPA